MRPIQAQSEHPYWTVFYVIYTIRGTFAAYNTLDHLELMYLPRKLYATYGPSAELASFSTGCVWLIPITSINTLQVTKYNIYNEILQTMKYALISHYGTGVRC